MDSRNTLFLCVANSARSQIAEGVARRLCAPGQEVFSAGSDPGRLHPLAVTVMREIGIDPSGHYSKGLDEVPLERVERVITLCGEEICPLAPAAIERLHWPLSDPAAQGGDEAERLGAFRAVRDEIRARLEQLFGRRLAV